MYKPDNKFMTNEMCYILAVNIYSKRCMYKMHGVIVYLTE